MSQINYKEIKDLKELRERLKPILTSTEYDYSWVKNIVETSLDEYLLLFLSEKVNEPQLDRYVTLNISEHFSEVTNLITKCTELRKKIFDIESTAITTAISYNETINSITPNEKLSALNLKAVFNLSQEADIVDFQTAQNTKNEIVKNILITRFKFHNQIGNSLNYAEIVDSLRKIYCDNIKTIYERLFIIKRTLKYSFNQETKPLPNFLEVKDTLDEFIWWIRHELDFYDFCGQYDFEHTIILSLNKPEDIVNLKTTGTCQFEITDFDVSNLAIDLSKYTPRVTQFSITLNSDVQFINEIRSTYDIENFAETKINPDHRRNSYRIDGGLVNNNENRSSDYAIKTNKETFNSFCYFNADVITPENQIPLSLDNLYNPTKAEEQQIFDDLLNHDYKELIPKIIDFKKGKFGNIEPIFATPNINTITTPNRFSYGPIVIGRKINDISEINKFRGNQITNIKPNGIWRINLRNISSEASAKNSAFNFVKNIELSIKLIFRKYN